MRPKILELQRTYTPPQIRRSSQSQHKMTSHMKSSSQKPLYSDQKILLRSLLCMRQNISYRRSSRCHAGARANLSEEWWNKNTPENMKQINCVQDFVDGLADSGDNLVLVDFYAKWCHACRSLFPKLCQICRDNPDIKLLKIDWDENKDIAKTLGVRVLPFFQVYRGAEGRVAEFSCSISKIQRLRDAIETHQAARCSLGLNPDLKEYFPQNKVRDKFNFLDPYVNKILPTHNMDRHEITILNSTGDSVVSKSLASFDEDEIQEQQRAREPVA